MAVVQPVGKTETWHAAFTDDLSTAFGAHVDGCKVPSIFQASGIKESSSVEVECVRRGPRLRMKSVVPQDREVEVRMSHKL